jgi:two-component system C4-dicarboxylate transport sensor histidine kinase DctB
VPHKVNFPSLVLYHILTNLILNAIQQKNKPLGIVIVQLRYEPEHELPIYIDVIDNSRGIHASHYDEIFKALFTTKPDGVGIGLYIAQSLANSNGASLALHESFVLGGSTFRLTLPHQIGEIS